LCGLGAPPLLLPAPVCWCRGWAWRDGRPHDTLTTGPATGIVGVRLASGMSCCPGRGWVKRRRGRCAALVRSGCAVCGPRLPAFEVSAGLLILGLAALVALVRPRDGHPRCTKIPPLYTYQNHSFKVAQPLGWGAASVPEYRIRAETTEPPTVPAGHFGAMMVMKQRGQRHPEASPLQKLLMGFFSRRAGQTGFLKALVVELAPSTPPCSVLFCFRHRVAPSRCIFSSCGK
jgi:hypothetical protein